MVSGTAKFAHKCEMVILRDTDFLVICENDMLRNGNSGLKMGVSRAEHTQYAYIIWKYPPPPPGSQECKSFEIDAVTTKKSMTEYYH